MFCKNCGAELLDNASVCLKCGVLVGDGDKYCPNCGAEPDPKAVICVKCGYNLKSFNANLAKNHIAPQNIYNLKEAIRICYAKYTDFSGRACRAEYWYWQLFNMLIPLSGFVILILFFVLDLITNEPSGEYQEAQEGNAVVFIIICILWLIALGNLIPTLAVTVRRLHDIGKSGWWYFIVFIPIIGGILLLIWMCQDSEHGINEYGKNPKGNENNQLYKLH